MPEGQNGNFDKGQRPSAGEQQARAAEKIIQDAQRRERQPNLGNERSESASTSATGQEHKDTQRLEDVRQAFKYYDKWKQHGFRKDGERQSSEGYPRVITPNGVATNPEELSQLSEEFLKESDKRFERQRREAVARLNTFARLPFWEKMSMLISGAPTDEDKYNEILEQERKRQGL